MSAMKTGDKVRTNALRAIKTAIMQWETAKENVGKTLDEATEINIVRKLVAQYEDTATQCNDGKHDEIVKEATDTANILKEFLPAPVTEEDIKKVFYSLVDTIEPVKKNMGTFIKEIKAKLPAADGKAVSQVVMKNLN